MNKENIPVITDREELYDKCENMEQLFDKYYLTLLDKHYSKTYKLQQENQELKKQLEDTIKSYTYENNLRHEIDLKLDIAKTQQKEFINFLEKMWEETQDIWYIKILSKYKEIVGDISE